MGCKKQKQKVAPGTHLPQNLISLGNCNSIAGIGKFVDPLKGMTTEGPFSKYFAGQPRSAVLVEASLLVLLIGYVDYITGYEISVAIFYSLPILFAVWYSDRLTSILVALLCGATWAVADIGHPYASAWIAIWDAWVGLLFFLFVVFGGDAIKAQMAEARARVEILEPFHVLAKISPVGIFRTDIQGRCLYMNERWIEIAGGGSAKSLQEVWTRAIHPDDRERMAREWVKAAEEGGPFQFECRFRGQDERIAWVLGCMAPEMDNRGGIRGYVGSITEMTDHRRLETEVLEISEREQRRIGQDLHDGLCQDLAAIQFVAASLKGDLQLKSAPETAAAREIADLLKDAIVQARNLARAIFPVKLERIGLASALEELAQSVSHLYKVSCTFETQSPIPVYDHAIAQEAVNNALKHGQAKTIAIALSRKEDRLNLTVENDGRDFPTERLASEGMGLHIMRYRARMIGASLLVEKQRQGGAIVSCTLREEPGGVTLPQDSSLLPIL